MTRSAVRKILLAIVAVLAVAIAWVALQPPVKMGITLAERAGFDQVSCASAHCRDARDRYAAYFTERRHSWDRIVAGPEGFEGVPAIFVQYIANRDPVLRAALNASVFDVYKRGGLNYVGLKCASCHLSQVRVGNDIFSAYGGSASFNLPAVYRSLDTLTTDEFYARFRRELWQNEYGRLDWPVSVFEKLLVLLARSRIVAEAKNFAPRTARHVHGFAYNYLVYIDAPRVLFADDASYRQYLEAFNDVTPAKMPVTWQGRRNRDKALKYDALSRNAQLNDFASGFFMFGRAEVVNFPLIRTVSDFDLDLPAPPYPFAIDEQAAARGAKHYARHCASCHDGDGVNVLREDVGTDASRLGARLDPQRRARVDSLLAQVRAVAPSDIATSCQHQPERCTAYPDGGRGGYYAPHLAGVWVRAAYFHNGSVPTLRQLLFPEQRAGQFFRGNLTYNEHDVGFAYAASEGPLSVLFDTTAPGQANGGHDGRYLRSDSDRWVDHPADAEDLLEYLKTL